MVRCSGVLGLALFLSSTFSLSCASHVAQSGGETNWLCESDSDCTSNLRCVQRRCAASDVAKTPGSGGAANAGMDPSVDATAGNGTSAGGATEPARASSGGVSSASTGCDTNYARYGTDSGPEVSLRNDVMPIFGLSCNASDCHNARDRKSGLDLGWPCAYDVAKGSCIFPAAADPNTTSSNPPKPLTEEVVNAVYASLLGDSATAAASGVKQVVPGDPSRSFLMDKLADTQGQRGYTCTNQDPSHETNPLPCGAPMPLGGGSICQSEDGQTRFDLVARWIAEGAPNN